MMRMTMQKIKIAFIFTLMLLVMTGCNVRSNKVDKDTVKEILTSIYTPESLEKFNEYKEDYVKRGLITAEEAESLFHSNGQELTQDDLDRKIQIDRIIKSDKDMNSMLQDVYKITGSITYKGKSTNFKITFSVNDDGAIDGHSYSEY